MSPLVPGPCRRGSQPQHCAADGARRFDRYPPRGAPLRSGAGRGLVAMSDARLAQPQAWSLTDMHASAAALELLDVSPPSNCDRAAAGSGLVA